MWARPAEGSGKHWADVVAEVSGARELGAPGAGVGLRQTAVSGRTARSCRGRMGAPLHLEEKRRLWKCRWLGRSGNRISSFRNGAAPRGVWDSLLEEREASGARRVPGPTRFPRLTSTRPATEGAGSAGVCRAKGV